MLHFKIRDSFTLRLFRSKMEKKGNFPLWTREMFFAKGINTSKGQDISLLIFHCSSPTSIEKMNEFFSLTSLFFLHFFL